MGNEKYIVKTKDGKPFRRNGITFGAKELEVDTSAWSEAAKKALHAAKSALHIRRSDGSAPPAVEPKPEPTPEPAPVVAVEPTVELPSDTEAASEGEFTMTPRKGKRR